MRKFFLLAAAAIALLGCQGAKDPDGVITTTSGKISGLISDNGVYSYLGVPYAESEKFMPPHSPKPWDGVLECTLPGPRSLQEGDNPREGVYTPPLSFDCQNLNIWTATLDKSAKRPVMFWIHGGGYASGSSLMFPIFDGGSLASGSDVVVVSVNHRLNITGYLDLSSYGEQYESTSGAGILDIVAALEWVRDNISSFGGDPNNVTIFGESGGGGKVAALLCMPKAKGLIHKAIIESGSMPNVMTKEMSQRLGRCVIKHLFGSEDAFVKENLDTVSYKSLCIAGEEAIVETLGHREPGSSFMWGFCPSLDDITLSEQPFVPGLAEYSKDIPVIIGSNLNEFASMGGTGGNDTEQNYLKKIKSLYESDADAYMAAYKKAYPDARIQDMAMLDGVFRPRTLSTAESRFLQGGAPIYVYLFTQESANMKGKGGSYHGLEQGYVFDNIELDSNIADNELEKNFERQMKDLWVSFAKTGVPSAEGVPEWEPFTKDERGTMILNGEGCQMRYAFDEELQAYVLKHMKYMKSADKLAAEYNN